MQNVVFKLEDGSKAMFKQDTKLVFKFNPYHDELGRFTTGDGAVSFTYKPGTSSSHDKAIAREKERGAASGPKPEGNPENFKSKSPEELDALDKKLSKNMSKKATPEELKALKDYAWNNFGSVNKSLRMGTADSSIKSQQARINSLIDKCKPLSEDVKCYRGVGGKALGLSESSVDGVRSQIGKTILDEGFSSYSTSYGTARTFANSNKSGSEYGIIIETTFPKGHKLAPVSASGVGIEGERELLPKSGQKVKLVGYDVSESSKTILIKAEITD